MQIFGPHPWITEQEVWGGPSSLCLISPPGDWDTG